MRNSNGRMISSSAAPTIVENSIVALRRLLLESKLGSAPANPKEDGALSWKTYTSEMRSVWLESILLRHRHAGCRTNPNYEELLAAAVDAAVGDSAVPKDLASWRWGAFNVVEIQHPILGKIAVVRHWSGPGLQEQSGGYYTVAKAYTPPRAFRALHRESCGPDQSTLNTVTGRAGTS